MQDKPKIQVVLATTNKGKIRELAGYLEKLSIEVIGLEAFPNLPPIEENGTTFALNALIKARTVAQYSGLISIADDSGLEVDALDGQPGVHSARYAEDWPLLPNESHDQRNTRKLLQAMSYIPEAKRGCRFVTCMAAVRPDGKEMTVEGQWEGKLLTVPVGENGFGYDPVFFDPELGKSAAQLTLEQKNARSHRGKALRFLISRWQNFLC